jgi:hypothetical protein
VEEEDEEDNLVMTTVPFSFGFRFVGFFFDDHLGFC